MRRLVALLRIGLALSFLGSDCNSTKTYTAFDITGVATTPKGPALRVEKLQVEDRGFGGCGASVVETRNLLFGPGGLAPTTEPIAFVPAKLEPGTMFQRAEVLPNALVLTPTEVRSPEGVLWRQPSEAGCTEYGSVASPDAKTLGFLAVCPTEIHLYYYDAEKRALAGDLRVPSTSIPPISTRIELPRFAISNDRRALLALRDPEDRRITVIGADGAVAIKGVAVPIFAETTFFTSVGAGWVFVNASAKREPRSLVFTDAGGTTLGDVPLGIDSLPAAPDAPRFGAFTDALCRSSRGRRSEDPRSRVLSFGGRLVVLADTGAQRGDNGATIAGQMLFEYDEGGRKLRTLPVQF